MSTRGWWAVILILAIVIVVLAWVLFVVPAPVHVPTGKPVSSTGPETSAITSEPLSKRVTVTSPQSGATVGKMFSVSGEVPGPWFFEAVFPIQVRDKDNNVVGRAQGQSQGDWMTAGQVNFTATITVDANYHGPATLVLLKDNPSGLPENDDSVSIPIVVQ